QGITAKLADGVLNINVPKCTNTSNATQVAID
ncbi:MAG: Hsp20/alpha crystallin family protein, partial [Coriobacteriaceae bacterium]